MLLVDVMFSQLSVLRASKIRDALGGSSFIELPKKAKPGDPITVRIEHIQHSNRAGSNGESLGGDGKTLYRRLPRMIESVLGDKDAGSSDVGSAVLAGCRVGFDSGRWVGNADAVLFVVCRQSFDLRLQ